MEQELAAALGDTPVHQRLRSAGRTAEMDGRGERRAPARLYGDVHHVLTRTAAVYEHPWVRQLTVADLPLIASAPAEVQGSNWGGPRAMVEEGFAAAALVDGRLVAIAQVGALTSRHADIGVATLESYRRQGLSSAAASLVASWAQANGRIPVWSTGEDNVASLRVAQKPGFVEVSRRLYVIPAASGLEELLLYALGMGVVVSVLTVLVALVGRGVLSRVRRVGQYLEPFSPVLLLATGGYIVYYWLSAGGILG